MRDDMQKEKKKQILFWIWLAAFFFFALLLAFRQRERINPLTEEEFLAQAEISDREDITRAKIWLKHTVHGTDGVYYRYVVETDCPNWDFETRYVVKSPLDWVTDETSAVEVLVRSVQVSLPGENGRVYASGEYYTVPILGDLASEDIPLEEWKENLAANAYSAYLAEKQAHDPLLPIFLVLAAMPLICRLIRKKK